MKLVCKEGTVRPKIAGRELVLNRLYDDSGLCLHGLSTFLRACPSLTLLHSSINFLNDDSMRDLCRYLPNLVSIKIEACSNSTAATLFILAKECPVLSETEVRHMDLEVEDDFDMDMEGNYQTEVRHMDLELFKFSTFGCPICNAVPEIST